MPFQGKGLIDFDKKRFASNRAAAPLARFRGLGHTPKNKKTVRIPLMRNGRFFASASVITLALLAGF